MLKTYEFKTANGANIKLTAGDVTYKNEIVLDGDHTGTYETKTFLKADVSINGKEYGAVSLSPETVVNGTKFTKVATLHINDKIAVIQIPSQIFNEIYAGEIKRSMAREESLKREMELENKYQKNYNAVLKAMEE